MFSFIIVSLFKSSWIMQIYNCFSVIQLFGILLRLYYYIRITWKAFWQLTFCIMLVLGWGGAGGLEQCIMVSTSACVCGDQTVVKNDHHYHKYSTPQRYTCCEKERKWLNSSIINKLAWLRSKCYHWACMVRKCYKLIRESLEHFPL